MRRDHTTQKVPKLLLQKLPIYLWHVINNMQIISQNQRAQNGLGARRNEWFAAGGFVPAEGRNGMESGARQPPQPPDGRPLHKRFNSDEML